MTSEPPRRPPRPPDRSALNRRNVLRVGAYGAAAAATTGVVASWDRLTARDIPGRGENVLTVATLGTALDADARRALIGGFQKEHPDIPVRLVPVQATDWADFFSKILTQIAAGTAPDLVSVATEGTQLFADQLGVPLDSYVKRDAEELREYFADVHPSLIESMMYEGSLYQLPQDFNAANVYFNSGVLRRAGVSLPPPDWDRQDFVSLLKELRRAGGSRFSPYFWTNRMWGGVMPWLFVNDTNILAESKAPGGDWLWNRFYPKERRNGRGGGFRWSAPQATDDRVEEAYDFLGQLIHDGLSTRPEGGGGNNLVGVFAAGKIGATPAGGFWAGGLHEAGMTPADYDVQFFPRWRTQRHQFGAAGYAMLRTCERRDEAWEFMKFSVRKDVLAAIYRGNQTTPVRRSLLTDTRYASTGPRNWEAFYDTLDRFPSSGPIPAPPAQAAIEAAFLKHTSSALSSRRRIRPALRAMQSDLEKAMEEQDR